MARLLAAPIKCDAKFTESAVNFNMTQYVMTRWYRAPELLMGQMSYNRKIDLWSCGCILAELYLKCPLFRGDNMINQLKEIIQKMGTPNTEFRIKVLPIVNSLINAEGEIEPIPFSQLVPTAPKKVIDLLSHLLVYDPDQRWSAMQTLKHIFFMKYKNPLKEEICKSVLDLSFEVELSTIDLLKDALMNDILCTHPKQKNNHSFLSNMSESTKDKFQNMGKSIPNKCDTKSCRLDSSNSERTLSADSGKELGYAVSYFECEGSFANSSCASDISEITRLKTVSQFTKNKIINSIRKPKNKSNKKIVTAAQRQKERKDRKMKLKNKRDVKFKTTKIELSPMVYQEQLSDLDKSFLKKWEHATNNAIKNKESNLQNVETIKKEYRGNNCETISLSTANCTKQQPSEVDEMSAGLSALLLLDDIIEFDKHIVTTKPHHSPPINDIDPVDNLNSSTDNLDLLFDVDIDCVDLDLSILETYSCDLFK